VGRFLLGILKLQQMQEFKLRILNCELRIEKQEIYEFPRQTGWKNLRGNLQNIIPSG
jgi:hypothetical protein